MAITTLDGAIAGMRPPYFFLKVGVTSEAAGVMFGSEYLAGQPGACAIPASGVAGSALTTGDWAGQIPFTNATSGSNVYLARLQCSATIPGTVLLVDRMWHNSGLGTGTALQTINSAAWPARDLNGTTTGLGVCFAVEATTTMTNTATTAIRATYINTGGTTSRTASIPSFPATAVKGSIVPFALATGDTGVTQIQTITNGTSLTTAYSLVAYRVLASVEIPVAQTGNSIDFVTGGAVKCYNGTVPFIWFIPNATTATTLNGHLIFTEG